MLVESNNIGHCPAILGEHKQGEPIPSSLSVRIKTIGVSVKEGSKIYFIPYNEIIYISAHEKKCIVHTADKEYSTRKHLKYFSHVLPFPQFVRIHKGYLVNLYAISHIEYFMGGSYLAYLKDSENTNLPVGRTFVPTLKKTIGLES